MGSIKEGKLLYHLTPLDSLESIIKTALMSREMLYMCGVDFLDTANHEILAERERLNLSGYIPFHFHIHTAYDTAVKNSRKDIFFVYLCLHREYARTHKFKILPIHPASSQKPELYDYDVGFNMIKWNIMELNKPQLAQNNIKEDEHKLIRMAECLSPVLIPISDFNSIAVPNENVKKYVEGLLNKYGIIRKPFVNVQQWF